MRTKNFIIALSLIVALSVIMIMLGPGPANYLASDNDSTLLSPSSQLRLLADHPAVEEKSPLDVDSHLLTLLGYPEESRPENGGQSTPVVTSTRPESSLLRVDKLANFSLVSYVLTNQVASAVQLVKNFNDATDHHPQLLLLLYDLGLNGDDQRTMEKLCFPLTNTTLLGGLSAAASPTTTNAMASNQEPPSRSSVEQQQQQQLRSNVNTTWSNANLTIGSSSSSNQFKCLLIKFDLVAHGFPSYVVEDTQMHAYRPLLVAHALQRLSRNVLWLENSVRLRQNAAVELMRVANSTWSGGGGGIKGWRTDPTLAVSARTHPKMYEYFHTDDDNFKFLKMISLDALFFVDEAAVHRNILLPWIKCVLVSECIHPIGAQSNGCKLNKKPQYRYSGCHDYDASALNIVLGLTFNFDDQKYALDHDRESLFYTESLDEATRLLSQLRKNNSETAEHSYTED